MRRPLRDLSYYAVAAGVVLAAGLLWAVCSTDDAEAVLGLPVDDVLHLVAELDVLPEGEGADGAQVGEAHQSIASLVALPHVVAEASINTDARRAATGALLVSVHGAPQASGNVDSVRPGVANIGSTGQAIHELVALPHVIGLADYYVAGLACYGADMAPLVSDGILNVNGVDIVCPAAGEYRRLLEVACGNVPITSASSATVEPVAVSQGAVPADAGCWPILWRFGLISGDPTLCWFACGYALAWEVDAAIDVVLGAWGIDDAEAVGVDAVPLPSGGIVPVTEPPMIALLAPGPASVWDTWGDLIRRHFPPERWAEAATVIWCESRGNPDAKNPHSSASGLAQFIASTWRWASAEAGWAGYSPFHAEANVASAAWLVMETGGWSHWVCAAR